MDLLKLSKYFKTTRSVDQVQQYLNGIVEKQRVEIYQDNVCIKIILHLINNDNITIPLTKKLIKNENNNYYNIPNITNQISNQYTQPHQPPNDMDNINYLYTVNYTNPQIDKDNANNNQLQTQINEIKMNYESKIAKLQNKLNKEKNNNKGLIDENNILKEKINNLNVKIEKLKGKIELLQNKISQKDIEIQKMSQNNINNIYEITSIKKGEKIMSVNFVSMGVNAIGHYSLFRKITDLFVRLEERLYEDFPQFKEYETYFEVKTKRLKRFKTLEENNIKTNDIINVFIIDN